MGFGRYRFRRSFGQVKAQFRGARPKFYPLFTGLLDTYAGAAAAYSLRRLSKIASSVVRVRRASDNAEKDFTADNITDGAMVNWVNGQIVPPLDIRELDANGERTGDLVEAAAAYSLRNLSSSFTGSVVEVRRSSDDAEDSFTASDVADGTLTDWVTEDITLIDETSFPVDSGGFESTISGSTFTYGETLDGKTDVLYSTFDGGGLQGLNFASTTTIAEGDTVTYSFVVYWPSDNTGTLPALTIRSGNTAIGHSEQSIPSADNWHTISGSFVATQDATSLTLYVTSSTGRVVGDTLAIASGSYVVTSASGFVSKWYDQSGNANHATQGTDASQPKIVDGGSLVNGGILSDGAGTFLELNSALSISDEFDIFFTGTATASDWSGLQRSPYGFSTNADYPRFNDDSFRYTIAGSDSGTISYNSGFTIGVGNPFLYNFNRNAADSVGAQINGIAQTNRVTLSGTHQISQLFRRGANTWQVWDGVMSEMIFYNSDQSDNRTAIEANIGEVYSIDLPSGVDTGYDQVDGFVETWYDQSGNGNDAVQQVSGSQPKIVDAGVLVSGGLDFDGVDDFLELGDLGISQPTSVIFVHNSDTDGGSNTNKNDFLDGTSVSSGRTLIDHSGTFYRVFAGASEVTSKTLVANQDALIFTTINDTSSEFSLDGSNETGLTAGTNGMDEMTLGASISGGRYDGTFAEFIIYDSNQSANRVAIETDINDHYDIYA